MFAQELDQKVFWIQNNAAKANDKVLEADFKNLGKNGAKIYLKQKQDVLHQIWKFEATEQGKDTYYIINQSPKAGKYHYLEVAWNSLGQDGGKTQLWEFNGGSNVRYGPNQVWKISKNHDGTYTIMSAHPKSNGKVLEVDSFTQQNENAEIQMYFNSNNPNQVWNLIEKK